MGNFLPGFLLQSAHPTIGPQGRADQRESRHIARGDVAKFAVEASRQAARDSKVRAT